MVYLLKLVGAAGVARSVSALAINTEPRALGPLPAAVPIQPTLPVIPAIGASYDYIIVGAGTSGATLAARLAEDPSITVALLEAGGDTAANNPQAYIPGNDELNVGADPTDTNPTNDWGFVTVPQTGAKNRTVHYSRGKTVGGTSHKNFMIYQRPTVKSFEYWSNATRGSDSPGWSWEDVLPYFTKSVVISPPDNKLRGANKKPTYNSAAYPETDPTKAPLHLAYPNFSYDYSHTMNQAFNELGYPNSTDFNSGTLNGVGYTPSTIRHSDGHRSTSQFYLDNARSRSNLVVITHALVKKVIFDKDNNAVAVTYSTLAVPGVDADVVTVNAKREIIISAGAFQSPQLLMVSGIGPAAHLKSHGIPVIVDLPGVGQNMQDHVFFSPAVEINPSIYTPGTLLKELPVATVNFTLNNLGALTNPLSEMLGWQQLNSTFFRENPSASELQRYPDDWPHLEYIAAPGYVGNFGNLVASNLGFSLQNRSFYSMLATLVAPLSRGSITLASADSADAPLIDPAWLTSPGDQAVAVEAYRKVRRLLNTPAFKATRINDVEFYPGYDVERDAEILGVIQNDVMTVWHAACTCAMQPRDNNGVLDPYLRVYGVQRLRVVDASSFPSLPPGHPQSTCYMIAERAADLIKEARGAPVTTKPYKLPAEKGGKPYMGPN